MPTLLNPKHEKFVQLLSSGMSATQAYISAGYSKVGAGPSAYKLLKNPKVKNRLEELQRAVQECAVKGVALSRENVLNRLAILSAKAEDSGQMSAAIRAEELRGKELGMFVDRSDSKLQLDQKSISEMSPAVLEEILRALRKRAADAMPPAAEAKGEAGGEVVQ